MTNQQLPVPSGPDMPARHASRADAPAEARAQTGLAWLLLAAIGSVGFVTLTVIVASHITVPFDQPILTLARGLGVAPDIWRALSESANIPLVVIGLGIVVWLLATHRRREALIVFLMLAAVTAGSEGVKQLTARPRPEGTDPAIPGVVYSYPSGHVLEALTILGIITIRTWRGARPTPLKVGLAIAVGVWVVLVGVARMGLDAHFPTDVLAGLLGGCAALGIYGWLTRDGGDREPTRAPASAAKDADHLLRASEGA